MTSVHVDAWKSCLQLIKLNVTAEEFKAWFEPIRSVGLTDQKLTIEVPSMFFYERLEEHYLNLLKQAVNGVLGSQGRLEYIIGNDHQVSNDPQRKNEFPQFKKQTREPAPTTLVNPIAIPGLDRQRIKDGLNDSMTFDNFVEGDCNRVARAAGYAVSQKPGDTAFNPLVIYSGVGLGKTHLLMAIGNAVKAHHPRRNVLYIPSEKFTNQFVEASRSGNVSNFLQFYEMIDVFLVDDIQFLAGKEKTQDHFFHVFNQLRTYNKQVVLASDKSPHNLEGMEERLLSRFKWGLSAQLTVPDFETRKRILITKMTTDGVQLPPDVVNFIANHITSNIRELEGAFISLLAQSTLNNEDVDINLARKLLETFVQKVNREITIEAIQKIVGDHLEVDVELMKDKTRKREIVQARQIAMFLAKEMTRHSLKGIGQHFGGRDHSTVIHALQTVNDLMETDRRIKQSVNDIRQRINSQMN